MTTSSDSNNKKPTEADNHSADQHQADVGSKTSGNASTDSPNANDSSNANKSADGKVTGKVDTTANSTVKYPTYTAKAATQSKPNWLWVLPLVLVALAIGVFAGQWWQQKQLEANASDEERTVSPQVATATGVTEVEKEVTQKPVLTVETVKPEPSEMSNDLSADGTISPENVSSVSGKVSGVALEQVLVKEGSQVKKGQVLAVFDTDAIQQQIIQAQAELAEAESNYDLAKKDAERVLPLLDIRAISEQEADRYVATANQAAASVAASRARLNNQKVTMQNAKVTAPVSGVISEKNADVGNVPGPEPLFTIIEDGQLEWQAQVDPNKVGSINVGTTVEVSLPDNRSVSGKVTRISPTAEEGSRQITIYASLNRSPYAKAGMYQRGVFKLGSNNQITIPVSAVITQDGYDYVMQVRADTNDEGETIHRVSRVKVALGERQGDRVILLEPLETEDPIVRQGGNFLSDGDVVRVAQPEAATADQ
ncbi:efflux RND transporter periplasmic adaptor subunit [Psychrobacter sp. FDAARGOS_221]|uniref:efflux RND transporter periplasmic adaptor subunit n=1 Tax=Psychrobacter sp. FDAARGOS_221 TaxID=1975705 RepID=UPI000BB56322|nr:efflux RND transporter periplasmic adaptor subunit [Psychrobacter sp. FDAARGOS_221]PNK60722.1 efflux RND transporter periplasmic adaptor subunit [Psychrobacter sp. FDAARGOS_221]